MHYGRITIHQMTGFLSFFRVYGLKRGCVASATLFFLSFFLLINNLAKLMQSKERAGQRVYLGLSEINIFMCCKCKAFVVVVVVAVVLLINNLAKLMQSKERGYILVSVN